jgi:hypothetical protein
VILAAGTGTRSRGRIVAQGPAVFLVKLDPGTSPPARNSRVALFFRNAAGIFAFRTRITDLAGEAVHLEHSTQVSHFQRRKYYRRMVRLPVLVTRVPAAMSPRQTILLDLGGGGASLQNPQGLFGEGDALRMWFFPGSERLAVAGTVVRVSKNGTYIHVRFESLSEAGRNRILGFLFRQPQRREIRAPAGAHRAAGEG